MISEELNIQNKGVMHWWVSLIKIELLGVALNQGWLHLLVQKGWMLERTSSESIA
jgi:hypothetical protein